MTRLQSLRKDILLKKEILSKTKTQLKAEFIGIDQVIDEVIDNISSWYFFPFLQDKPVIINLWGLTGVGKSSLVKCIAKQISFDEKCYQFLASRKSRQRKSVEAFLIMERPRLQVWSAMQAGGIGITLTASSEVLFIEFPWTHA
jgi:hypothetical protein